jgi:hypothetical protein
MATMVRVAFTSAARFPFGSDQRVSSRGATWLRPSRSSASCCSTAGCASTHGRPRQAAPAAGRAGFPRASWRASPLARCRSRAYSGRQSLKYYFVLLMQAHSVRAGIRESTCPGAGNRVPFGRKTRHQAQRREEAMAAMTDLLGRGTS